MPFQGSPAGSRPPAKASLVYAGTHTTAKGKGIYAYWVQTEGMEVSQNITLVPMGLAAETSNPSFLEIEPKRRLLLAVNEQESGSVSAFSIEPGTGRLKPTGQRPSAGSGPCHLALDRTGKYVLVANYGSGSVAVLSLGADGQLGEPSSVVQHSGKGADPQRQAGPHASCVTVDPANRFVFVCDLGLDRIMSYRFDADTGKLSPNDPPAVSVKAGAGPRRLVFRPDGRFAYAINELNSTITAFSYDTAAGKLTEIQSVSSVPEWYDGPNNGAEIGAHPSGKWLYASNCGMNTVVLFNVDAAAGTLSFVEEQGTGGKIPRHFGIEPNAKHLTIANRESDTLLICRIDPGNGRLKPSGLFAECPSPACAKFLLPG